jgi:hypothetical protein
MQTALTLSSFRERGNERGFEYRLVPMTADQKVFRGAARTAKPKVQ